MRFLFWDVEEITAQAVNGIYAVETKHLVRQCGALSARGSAAPPRSAIHLPVPFTCSTVCKDGLFVLKLPLLQQFFHLAEKRWKDWLCSTNIPQFAHICGKSPSAMSEVQKWSVIVKNEKGIGISGCGFLKNCIRICYQRFPIQSKDWIWKQPVSDVSIHRHRNRFLAIRSHYSDDVLITNESYRSIQFNRWSKLPAS